MPLMSADLRGLTIATPSGSTSHYQLLYLLGILNLTGTVTVKLAQPSELADLWQNDKIDGAYVWVRMPAPAHTHQVIMDAQHLSPCGCVSISYALHVHAHTGLYACALARATKRASGHIICQDVHAHVFLVGTNTWESQPKVSEFADLCQWCCTGRVGAFPLMQPTYLRSID